MSNTEESILNIEQVTILKQEQENISFKEKGLFLFNTEKQKLTQQITIFQKKPFLNTKESQFFEKKDSSLNTEQIPIFKQEEQEKLQALVEKEKEKDRDKDKDDLEGKVKKEEKDSSSSKDHRRDRSRDRDRDR